MEDATTLSSLLPTGDVVWLSPGTRLAGFGAAWRSVPMQSPDRFSRASADLRAILDRAVIEDDFDVPGSGPVAFGSFSFDWRDAGSWMVIPSVIYGIGESGAWKTEIKCEPGGGPNPGGSGSSPPPQIDADSGGPAGGEDGFSEWKIKFEEAQKLLRSGALEKIVLARKVEMPSPPGLAYHELLPILAREFPGCYTFRLGSLVGASPELLVRKLGTLVDSIPLAGSAPRGADEALDQALGAGLMTSSKNLREHHLTRQAVIAALEPLCSTLEAEHEPSLLLLSNVQHLSTKVQGRLREDLDCLELAAALHPTPAVCGVPQDAALEAIRRLENFNRGPYAGPVGWMDHRGDGEWAIALRCGRFRSGSATLFAGAGIIAESDGRSEYLETELKLQAVRSALEQASGPSF